MTSTTETNNQGENEMNTLEDQIKNAQDRQKSFSMTALMYKRIAQVLLTDSSDKVGEEFDRATDLARRYSEAAQDWMNKLCELHKERAASIA
jgi:hypothetical protein